MFPGILMTLNQDLSCARRPCRLRERISAIAHDPSRARVLSARLVSMIGTRASSTMPAILLWIGVLAGHVRGSLAAATGVDSAEQAVKYLLAGADVVMTTSALCALGSTTCALLEDLTAWLDA